MGNREINSAGLLRSTQPLNMILNGREGEEVQPYKKSIGSVNTMAAGDNEWPHQHLRLLPLTYTCFEYTGNSKYAYSSPSNSSSAIVASSSSSSTTITTRAAQQAGLSDSPSYPKCRTENILFITFKLKLSSTSTNNDTQLKILPDYSVYN